MPNFASPQESKGAPPNPNTGNLVSVLNLHDSGLRSPPELLSYTMLRSLVLSFNRLTQLPDLSACTALQRLDCGHNEISSVQGLAFLERLTHCDLNSNRLFTIQTVVALSRSAPNITWLDLSENDVLCARGGYRAAVLKAFCLLSTLDGTAVTDTQRQTLAQDTKQELDEELIMEHCYINRESPEFESLVPPHARAHTNQYSRVRISDFLRLYQVPACNLITRVHMRAHTHTHTHCRCQIGGAWCWRSSWTTGGSNASANSTPSLSCRRRASATTNSPRSRVWRQSRSCANSASRAIGLCVLVGCRSFRLPVSVINIFLTISSIYMRIVQNIGHQWAR